MWKATPKLGCFLRRVTELRPGQESQLPRGCARLYGFTREPQRVRCFCPIMIDDDLACPKPSSHRPSGSSLCLQVTTGIGKQARHSPSAPAPTHTHTYTHKETAQVYHAICRHASQNCLDVRFGEAEATQQPSQK